MAAPRQSKNKKFFYVWIDAKGGSKRVRKRVRIKKRAKKRSSPDIKIKRDYIAETVNFRFREYSVTKNDPGIYRRLLKQERKRKAVAWWIRCEGVDDEDQDAGFTTTKKGISDLTADEAWEEFEIFVTEYSLQITEEIIVIFTYPRE